MQALSPANVFVYNKLMNGEKIRLQKYLAAYGVASRRAAEQMIAAGRVAVNGRIVEQMGVLIDPAQDQVSVDGQPLTSRPALRYLLLFKPTGYICSVHDERGRRTVLDLLDGVEERVYPVGRLDYDTSGLLLLTNDGALTHRLLHPSHQVEKTYLAEVAGVPSQQALRRLRQGVLLEDGLTAPARARLSSVQHGKATVELTIHEGRNRQVRRMLAAVGYPVQRLRRVALGFLTLDGLHSGQWRELSAAEVARLRKL